MEVFIGGIGQVKKAYTIYFLHQRSENVEYEDVVANSEKKAIELAIKKHRLTYPRLRFTLVKVQKY